MTDHHEPATAVAVPSPSSAVVPTSQSEHHSEIKPATLGQENSTNDLTPSARDKTSAVAPLHVEIHPGKKEPSDGGVVSIEVIRKEKK